MKQTITTETKLATSWMRRLKNGEFTHLMGMIGGSLERILTGDDNPMSHELENFMRFNNELQKMRPVQTSHSATRQIRYSHKKRVERLVYLLQSAKIRFECELETEEVRAKAQLIYNLISRYGTRYYDMGISNVTGKVNWIVEDVKNSPELQDALRTLRLHMDYEELVKRNNEVIEAQFVRATDIAQAKPERSYVEVRHDVYKTFQMILIGLNCWQDDERYQLATRKAYSVIEQLFAEYKSSLLQAEKRRKEEKDGTLAKKQEARRVAKLKAEKAKAEKAKATLLARKASDAKMAEEQRKAEEQKVSEQITAKQNVSAEKAKPIEANKPKQQELVASQHHKSQQHHQPQDHNATPTSINKLLDKVAGAVPLGKPSSIDKEPIKLGLVQWNGERWEHINPQPTATPHPRQTRIAPPRRNQSGEW